MRFNRLTWLRDGSRQRRHERQAMSASQDESRDSQGGNESSFEPQDEYHVASWSVYVRDWTRLVTIGRGLSTSTTGRDVSCTLISTPVEGTWIRLDWTSQAHAFSLPKLCRTTGTGHWFIIVEAFYIRRGLKF